MLRLRPRLTAPVLAVALGAGALLSPPLGVDPLRTLGRADAAAAPDGPQPATAPAGMAFPGVDGVDLLAIGYVGVDLDAVTVADLAGPLPELPTEQATELRSRIVVGTAHAEGLRGAEYVLYENARAMRTGVRRAGGALEAAAEELAEAGRRLATVRAEHEHHLSLPPAQRALLMDAAVSSAGVHAAELEVLTAAEAHAAAEAEVAAREARRHAHLVALDVTHRAANSMDAHIDMLYAMLHAARSGMLPAGRWLAEVERGRTDLPLATVDGFRVHGAIAGSLRDLLAAARADGIELRGDAYRSTSRQIELRRAHCGPTHYDIYEKPSSACSPPTAKPNRSLHETGLAVDFRHGDQGITSRRSPAYRWLAANAAAYGFFNLASEPWHWSVSAT